MRVTCPICRQLTSWEENQHRPFCSERCRMIDLGRWAADDYRIPAEDAPPGAGPETGPEPWTGFPDEPTPEGAPRDRHGRKAAAGEDF
jgi:endogenous inhibitor of DNA gyrase (YacG/DUF329 family)